MFLSKYLTDTFTNKSKHLLYTLNKKELKQNTHHSLLKL